MSSERQSSSPGLDDQIDLLYLLGVVWRGRIFVLAFTAIVTVLMIAFSIISVVLPPDKSPLPNMYEPEALLLVNDNTTASGLQSSIASSGLGGLAGLAGLAGVSTGGTYGNLAVTLLQTGVILDPIAEEFHIAERYHITKSAVGNSRKALLKHARFDYDQTTNTVSISYKDYDPKFARDITNRMAELLLDRFSTIGGNRNTTRRDLLEGKLVDVKVQIDKLAHEVEAFQRKHGILTVDALATEQITALAQLRASLIDKEMQIQTYSQFSRISDPTLARLQAERDNLKKAVDEMENGYSTYTNIGPTQRDTPALALQFETLQRNLDVQVKIYEILMQQYELAKLDVQGSEPVFQVLKLAEAPDLKSGPSRSRMIVLTAFAAFLMSVIYVIARNRIQNLKRMQEQGRRPLWEDR